MDFHAISQQHAPSQTRQDISASSVGFSTAANSNMQIAGAVRNVTSTQAPPPSVTNTFPRLPADVVPYCCQHLDFQDRSKWHQVWPDPAVREQICRSYLLQKNSGQWQNDWNSLQTHPNTASIELLLSAKTINDALPASSGPKKIPMDVNAVDGKKMSALMWAATQDKKELIECLLSTSSIDVNFQNQYGTTALMMAVNSRNVEAIRLLLNTPGIDVNLQDKCGLTALMTAASTANRTALELLLPVSLHLINVADINGKTLLMSAIDNNYADEKFIKFLLGASGIDVNLQNQSGRTALMMAVRTNNLEAIRLLLNTPDIDVNLQDEDGETALMKAASTANRTALELLLPVSPHLINVPDINGKTPLMSAIDNNYADEKFIEFLLGASGIDVNLQNRSGRTALMMAVTSNNLEAIRLLLNTPDIDVNLQDEDGQTALLKAHWWSFGPIVLAWRDAFDTYIIDNATHNRNLEIIRLLVNTPNIDLNVQDRHRETALTTCLRRSLEQSRQLRKLYSSNALDDTHAIEPSTGRQTSIEMLRLLLSTDRINVNTIDQYGKTPLDIAISNYDIEALKLLLPFYKHLINTPIWNHGMRIMKLHLPPSLISAIETLE